MKRKLRRELKSWVFRMVNVPDPNSVIKYIEAWQKFCDRFGDVVYHVLLTEEEAIFPNGTTDFMLYQKALADGEDILRRSFLGEDKFIEELKENPKI